MIEIHNIFTLVNMAMKLIKKRDTGYPMPHCSLMYTAAGYPDHFIMPCFYFSNVSNGQHVVYVSGTGNDQQQTEVSSIWIRMTIRVTALSKTVAECKNREKKVIFFFFARRNDKKKIA